MIAAHLSIWLLKYSVSSVLVWKPGSIAIVVVYTHVINLRISLAATGPFLAVVAAGVMAPTRQVPLNRGNCRSNFPRRASEQAG